MDVSATINSSSGRQRSIVEGGRRCTNGVVDLGGQELYGLAAECWFEDGEK